MKPGNDAATLPPALASVLKSLPAIAIAFSGGIDSRFLCHAARLLHVDAIAIHVKGPHIPKSESEWAATWAARSGLPYVELSCDPLSLPQVANNARDRCHACKRQMLATMKNWLTSHGQAERLICDGSNLDDGKIFRPGALALKEARVLSPLAQAGLTKKMIRESAAQTGLEFPDQPSRPCLLTRFAYDYPIAPAKLRMVEKVEKQLKAALTAMANPPDFRLRFRPEPVLHLTRKTPGLESDLAEILNAAGIGECPIEELNPLSGFFDRPDRLS